jgi:glycogen debranching enzyme
MFFTLNSPIVISTVPCTAEEACRIMADARAELAGESRAYGRFAEAFLAMQCCLGWNAIYDPCKNRICSPVSRNWNRGAGGRLFCWDTFFGALMLSLENEKFSYLNIKAILDEMTEDGMIPNAQDSHHSQPFVGSMVLEEIYRKNGDIEFLREVYPCFLRWNTWCYENRMTAEGYLCWGTGSYGKDKENLFGAKCESGMDNSPIFDDAVYDEASGLCMIADVGFSGLFIKDCRSLIYFSEILGYSENVAKLKFRMNRAQRALDTLWNEADGIFENLDLATGNFCGRISPFNFFSLFSPTVSEEQKKAMVSRHLLNEAEFWGEYVLPSISKNDPAFTEQHYWRGRIWAPLNAIVYHALKDAKLDNEAKLLAEKSEKLLLKGWEKERRIYENYGATDGLGSSARQSDAFYHWGALLGYIAIDAEQIVM